MSTNATSSEQCDVLVVGGGINGAGIAADAAGRGLKVMLCEQNDLGGATSSASSKLIHGGLRYLEHYEFRLVREALAEREVLLAKAPHIIWPLRFRLPHQSHLRPAWMIRAGLFLYDSLARRKVLPRSRRVKPEAGDPLNADIKTTFEYSDGWVDDARLVVLNAMAARDQGAVILPRTECVSAIKQGKRWLATLQSKDGTKQQVSARCIVNAAGPWAISFLDRMAGITPPGAMRLVKGSHIVVPKMYDSSEAYILQNKDKRIVFVIPYEDDFTLIGTTDEDFQGDPGSVGISDTETDYLLDIVNHYFTHSVAKQDIVHTYSGVRPLLEEANATAQELTRDYKVVLSGDADSPLLLNVFGGKITTYRKLAEHAVNTLSEQFKKTGQPWTKSMPLPGGSFSSQQQLGMSLNDNFPWLPAALARRYVRQYGTLCKHFLAGKHSLSDMGEHFGGALYQAEVDYLRAHEWAVTAEDILWRRTKLGLRLSPTQKAALESYLSSYSTEACHGKTA
ncbi:glycerol-3-phosphate dehydrogenase [Alteromonas halophila]|uniref:Glycerol-3-phosphate dehydrogenase n=1 Tax=Alteromonas halophila TaxID=516698 RepID=A0A918JHG5_9ALTE|nr:glycerol-3-phosphate dehydrogenase [Alteromonas halophila]GGW81099.1 glycerol-3-phosphate dehydrogenase [Alteromonas halophila]